MRGDEAAAEAPLAPEPRVGFHSRSDGPPAQHGTVDSVTLTLAGELENADELRARFGATRQTDAELVADGYRRSGVPFFSALRGRFAFVLRDARTGTLAAVRDPMGLHPLFYAETEEGDLEFADSIGALLEHPGVRTDLNKVALAEYVRLHWPHRSETYFEAVRRVPPGHALIADGKGIRVERYWDPAAQGPVEWVERDDLDRFEELLERAVARSLADRPAGIFLSGGLDSVSVAAVAVDLYRRRSLEGPLALSLVFPDADANEELVQRRVARDLGLEQVVLDFYEAVGEGGLLAAAAELSSTWPAPLLNTWYPAYRSLAAEGSRRGCRVIVTGSGGDEWLGVSPFLAADVLRSGNLVALLRMWQSANRSFPLPSRTVLRSTLWTFGARPLVIDAAQRLRPALLRARRRRHALAAMPSWFAPDGDLRAGILDRVGQDEAQAPGIRTSFYVREMRRALDHAVVSMEMEENFEIGLRSGLPFAAPYWDPDLVDFLFRTPPRLLSEGGRSKGLVRQVLKRRFPDLGFEQQRKVLASNFFARVMTAEAKDVLHTLGGIAALDELGIADGSEFESTLQNAIQTGDNWRITQVWHVLNLESWVRSNVRERG
jgi:asparagine synthase (glutamine-hydrolysing)